MLQIEVIENYELKTHSTFKIGGCAKRAFFPKTVDEFVQILKELENPEKITLRKSDFKDLITKTIFSVAVDDARPILKGCLFEISAKEITAVALDGFRLALVKKKIRSTTAEFSCIVPARTLGEISKLLETEEDEDIEIYIQRNYLLINLGNTKIITRLLDGEFINYKQVIPANISSVVTINTRQLQDGLDRASLLAKMDKNNLVRFDIKDTLLTLTSSSDIGNVTENITIALEGKDLSIAFNARYFSDCIKIIDDEFVKINFTSPIAPCTISSTENGDYLYLILPVRIMS